MSTYMTIQEFSERTGVSKSALRYYESKNLLRSVGRNPSGYRIYSDDQVANIKLISSLRLVDIPIKDIEGYLKESNEHTRQYMMNHWIQMIKKRRDILNVSLRYLESDYTKDQIYLIEKSSEKIIWYLAESEVGNFREHIIKRGKELAKYNIHIKSFYLKYVSGIDLIKAHIGFSVPFDFQTSGLTEIDFVEHMAPCICIALSFLGPVTEIPKGYRRLFDYASEHEWVPTGPVIEWYRGKDFTDLDLLMPINQMRRKEDIGNG